MLDKESQKPRDWRLIEGVIKASVSKDWQQAKTEWSVVDYYESSGESCLCGKENITHCHTIENTETGETLGPIGSSCVEKFESPTMNEGVALSRTFVELNTAFNNYANIDDMRTLLRNKKLITKLADDNVFGDNITNDFYGKMVRKRTQGSDRQEAWFKRLVFYEVKPYVRDIVKDYHASTINHKSTYVSEQPAELQTKLKALYDEFSKPTTTLKQLYPNLTAPDTVEYLRFQNVFKDKTNEKFFTNVISGNNGKQLSDKQRTWFKDIVSKQIKPFVLDNVKEIDITLDMSDLDESLSQ